MVTGLTCLAVAVHGYHPYAEDGGLYLAGVKRLLDAGMYPHETAFVVEHLRFSVFAPAVAAIVRWSGLGTETCMFLLYLASFWLTLFAAWMLASRCYGGRETRTGAVALLAAWLTLPIAGTSLMLMDPYLTARSISTPCTLLALVGVLDLLGVDETNRRRWMGGLLCGGSLMVGTIFHPLMAAYALGCVVVLSVVLSSRASFWTGPLVGVCVVAVATGATLQAMSMPESSAYVRVAMTRTYWFLSEWHWYEWIGLIAPLVILSLAALREEEGSWQRLALARMSVATGTAAVVVALLFARTGVATHLVARLQPLRVFQLIYVVMILFVGAEVARRVLRRNVIRWVATYAVLCGVMLYAERQTFSSSAHIELPGVRSVQQNPWERAFLWVRGNTPKDALLALDADYIEKPGEDAQCFRAIAERSALPDYSKDGGEASITPSLTDDWVAGETAQAKLSAETDGQRVAALKPLGVSWVVLERDAETGFACDYANESVKVCRLPGTANRMMLSSRSQASQPLPVQR